MTGDPTIAETATRHIAAARRRIYALLEQSDGADGIGLALNRFLILVIVATLTATVIESGTGSGNYLCPAAQFG